MSSEPGPFEPLPLDTWTGRAWWYGCCGGCCLVAVILVLSILLFGVSVFRDWPIVEFVRSVFGKARNLFT